MCFVVLHQACTFFDNAILNTMEQVVMTVLWLPGELLPSAIQSLQIELDTQLSLRSVTMLSAKLNFCFLSVRRDL